MGTLDGAVAIVTGASRGIGKGCAIELAAAGAHVYLTGRTVARRRFKLPFSPPLVSPFRSTGPPRGPSGARSDVGASPDVRDALVKACPDERSPVVFANPTHVRGGALADYVTLEIEVDESLVDREAFVSRGRRVTQADFPELVSEIAEQARVEFGPRADRPD